MLIRSDLLNKAGGRRHNNDTKKIGEKFHNDDYFNLRIFKTWGQCWVKVDPSSRYSIISLLKTNTHLSSITTAIFGFNKSSILE